MTREVDINLKNTLVNNVPFKYAHLIKFERPSNPDSLTGLVSTSKQRYVYLTDASIDVDFNDGSTDLAGVANGSQTYLANKILSVGAIQEQTKATAGQTSIVVDGNALGAKLTATIAISSVSTGVWDLAFQAPVTLSDVLEEGLREGDKISVLIASVSYPVNITSFRAGETLRVSKIDTNLPVGTVSATLALSSEEVISILLNKNDPSYSSFINREVFIYRAYFDDSGVIIGAPINLFKGIIQNVSFEDTEQAVKVTWGITSHWGDFAQVRGRVTSDEFHRALDENGAPRPAVTAKPVYAYDKGFMHSETSLNLLAKYSASVEKVTLKIKKGFLGIGRKIRLLTTTIQEDRFTELNFQLSAKSIPVIYGVRLTEGVPIFADTLNTDSSTVYVITALCEGEIGGVYDVYVDNQSLICSDKADSDARSEQVSRLTDANAAIAQFCRGRADRGDVLGSMIAVSTTTFNEFFNTAGLDFSSIQIPENAISEGRFPNYVAPDMTPEQRTSPGTGLIDGQYIELTSPLPFKLDFFSGKPGQKAAAELVGISKARSFKIQNDYWKGTDTVEYWGPNHRLLDTAYLVGKFKISEGETTIPEFKVVVRGKLIDCYNYDSSYIKDRRITGESEVNFPLGATVALHRSDNDAVINASVQIIDKWTFFNPDGTTNTRFRFNVTPALGYVNGVPSITKFYILSGVNRWTMVTYNHKAFTGTLAANVSSGTLVKTTVGSNVGFTFASNADMIVEGDTYHTSPIFRVVTSTLDSISGSLLAYQLFTGTVTATAITTISPASIYASETIPAGSLLASVNTIKLPAAASATNDAYLGDAIEVTRFTSATGKSSVQYAEIIGYDGTSRIATIDTVWTSIPTIGDTVAIYPRYADKRVSINPAIQTADYMTSNTYGRGLQMGKDLNLASVTSTANKCEARADVSVGSNGSATAAAIYKYPATGNIIWQGKVTGSKAGKFATNIITFNEVIGKLTNKWNSWKSWGLGTIVYHETRAYNVTTAGIKLTAPTHTTGVVDGLTFISTMTLTKVSGTGVDLVLPTAGNPLFDEREGRKVSGYSIYDSDDIDYWRLSGWDGHEQRYVSKYQTNIQIDTSVSLFENINGMLEHYNGILRYTSGQYFLDLEEAAAVLAGTSSTNDVRIVTTDDIIGKIQLSDEGVRSSFNSMTAAFADPANKFEARNISFFNSTYLKIDRNVPKKGSLSIPGVTNYYNTRILADSLLNKSRYGLSINFTMRYHGILILAGSVIQVVYPRYGDGWSGSGKQFRVESVNYQADGLVDIVAKEYDASFYGLSNLSGGSSGTSIPGSNEPVTSVPGAPTNLVVTSADTVTELYNGVELFWENSSSALSSEASVVTEVYGGLSSKLYITVTSIATDTLTSSVVHGLAVGMAVYPQITANAIDATDIYYVVAVPTTTTFKLSLTKVGAPITLTAGTGLTITIRTATLLATVPVPARSYVDNLANAVTGRVEKYYWIRYKVLRS